LKKRKEMLFNCCGAVAGEILSSERVQPAALVNHPWRRCAQQQLRRVLEK